MLLLLSASTLILMGNLYSLSTLQGDAAAINYGGLGRMQTYRLLYLTERLPEEAGNARIALEGELRDTMRASEERFPKLLDGSKELGIPPATDPVIRASVEARKQFWHAEVRPALERLAATTGDAEARQRNAMLAPLLHRLVREIDEIVRLCQEASEYKIVRFRMLQLGFLAIVFLSFGFVTLVALDIRRRVLSLMTTARRISEGDLSRATPVHGTDEIAVLAKSLGIMTNKLTTLIEARDEFVAVASHELKAPLSTLVLVLNGLERAATSEPSAKLVTRAMRQTDRLTTLLNNLLDAARIAAGRLELRREEVDLAWTVREVISNFREDAERAACELMLRSETPAVGHWDPLRMEQVVTNLLSNALKYAPNHPIEIRVEPGEKVAKLTIADHGPGIQRDQTNQIFERFGRLATRRSPVGFGLGLYITRQIVEAHGGEIRVESELGQGCTFIVELPLN